MNIGISTASFFSKLYTEQSLELIGEKNVKMAEVFLDTKSEYSDDFAKKLAEIADRQGINISAVHAMSTQFEPQLFSIADRQKKDAIEVFKKVLKSAEILGAKKYVMHGPAMMLGAVKNININKTAPIIDFLAETARDYGVKLCFENVSWCLFCFPEFAKAAIDNCKSNNLFFTLDIKQAIRSGFSPYDYLEQIGGRLGHVHICDYVLNCDGKLKSLALPAKGEFDFAKFKRVLNDIGYDGDIIVEVYSDLYRNIDEVFVSQSHVKNIFEKEI